MAVYLASYATTEFYKSQQRLKKSALKFGIDKVFEFNPVWLYLFHRDFIRQNTQHFQHKKGAGYWVWKPYVILKTLEKIQNGDYLIYLDSGIEIVQPIDVLWRLCDENDGILLFSTFYYLNKNWTKRDVFVALNYDTPKFWNKAQLEAGMIVLQKNNNSITFIKQWLKWCENFQLINDDDDDDDDSFPNFMEHRHDQSLLSILAIKYNLEIHRSPSQIANNFKLKKYRIQNEYLHNRNKIPDYLKNVYAPEKKLIHHSKYGTLFFHHRNRNYHNIIKQFLILFCQFYTALKHYKM